MAESEETLGFSCVVSRQGMMELNVSYSFIFESCTLKVLLPTYSPHWTAISVAKWQCRKKATTINHLWPTVCSMNTLGTFKVSDNRNIQHRRRRIEAGLACQGEAISYICLCFIPIKCRTVLAKVLSPSWWKAPAQLRLSVLLEPNVESMTVSRISIMHSGFAGRTTTSIRLWHCFLKYGSSLSQ